jgi:CheY-like chemotaxis protein
MAEENDINLSFTTSHDSIILDIDHDKFGNIITNLLHNAFKHTPANGKIAVSVYIKPGKPDAIYSRKDVDIVVRDTGEGIPQDQQEKIFERFYQVSNTNRTSKEGTGLGLSLVRELTELHKGKVNVSSQLNRGSIFTLTFPMGKKKNAPSLDYLQKHPELFREISQRPEKHVDKADINDLISVKSNDTPHVLIVEDDTETRKFLRACLEDKYTICEARNGIEGIEIAQKADPDLIVSDVMMPEMDGCELCRRIKNNQLTSHIPVILLTARVSMEDKICGLEVGADDYIFKPFDSMELRTRIKNLIEQRIKLREVFHEEIIVQPAKITVTSADNVFLKKLIVLVELHIADPHFETQLLADQVGMSRMNLHRKIKAITGQTPGQFISTMRLKRAAQLIKDQAGNVTEVAYDVGFSSLSYFSRCFKSEFGVLPSEFAKNQEMNG